MAIRLSRISTDAGAEGGQDDELDVGHVADLAVLEQLVTAAVDEFAEVPRSCPVAEVVHGIRAVGHAVVAAEAVAVARETRTVVLHPEEQGAGDGPDGQHQQDDREAHGEQDLHHARGYRLGVRRVFPFGVPALHFLLRRADLQRGGGQRLAEVGAIARGAGSTAASAALRSARLPAWRQAGVVVAGVAVAGVVADGAAAVPSGAGIRSGGAGRSSGGALVRGARLHPVERGFVSVIGRIQLRILSIRRGGT